MTPLSWVQVCRRFWVEGVVGRVDIGERLYLKAYSYSDADLSSLLETNWFLGWIDKYSHHQMLSVLWNFVKIKRGRTSFSFVDTSHVCLWLKVCFLALRNACRQTRSGGDSCFPNTSSGLYFYSATWWATMIFSRPERPRSRKRNAVIPKRKRIFDAINRAL